MFTGKKRARARKSHGLFEKLMLCFVLLLSVLVCSGRSFANLPNPEPRERNVEIQGAKVISEGGYLWFHVINHESSALNVVVHFPSDVKVIQRTQELDEPYVLGANKSVDFFFQVPYYWNGTVAAGETREITFSFKIFTLYRNVKIGTEYINFTVKVMPLNWKADNHNLVYMTVFVSTIIPMLAAIVAITKIKKIF